MKPFKLWVFTQLEYDEFGNAKIVKNFVKPAKESAVQKGIVRRAKKTTVKHDKAGEKELW